MHPIFSALGQAFRKSILVVGLMISISLLGLFTVFVQPSYAATSGGNKLTPEEKIDRAYQYSEATGLREEDRQEAYQEEIKEAQSLESQEKAYEKAEKAFEKANPGPGIVEQAKGLVDKVTGKE